MSSSPLAVRVGIAEEIRRNLSQRVESSFIPSNFRLCRRTSDMSILHRQTLQQPSFRVLWPLKTSQNRRLPLQIRSFTSDSYRALKEREETRESRQRGKHKRWHEAQSQSGLNEGPAEAATEVPPMGFECDERIVALDSDSSLSPVQDDLKAQAEDRPILDLLDSPRIPEGEMQAVDVSSRFSAFHTSPSPHPVPTRLEHPGDLRQTCDTTAGPNNDQNIPSTRTPVKAIPDEAGDVDQLLGDGSDHERHTADSITSASSERGGYATCSDLDYSGCPSNRDRSLRLATLDAHATQPRRPAAMVETVKSTSAEHFEIDTRQLEEIAEMGPCDMDSRYEGRIFDSTLQIAWTTDLDGHLLHLRDVAQLNWQTLVTYFPGTALNDVRRRYQQLKKAAADQAKESDRSSRSNVGSVTHVLADARDEDGQPTVAKTYPAQTSFPTKRPALAPRRPARRRRTTAEADRFEPAASSMPSAHRDTPLRTSRCGRKIRHPFRHRPSEGYL